MRQTELFTRTQKDNPSEEVAKNAQLLIRAGYIDKLQAGVYTYLPLGLRVLRKIETIIREEMNKVGGQEVLMPSLHPKENWETTGRWTTMDDLYKVKDASGRENALGPTHEEIVVPLAKQFISSYKDLPFGVYQFQNKFRMELRAKSGILRGREFIMKDFYSFHRDEKDLKMYYEIMKQAYREIFKRVGIGERTYVTYASGGSFSKYSHEFQTLTSAGEDIIYLCDQCAIAVNKEIKADQPNCPQCGATGLREEKAIEVGNIFELKTKFTEPFKVTYKDEKGELQPVVMGCYGIGLGRVMGTIVEVLSDEKGIVWPESVAPFRAHLISLKSKTGEAEKAAEELYKKLRNENVEVLFDDRDATAGQKLNDADLLGIPYRIVVSEKTLEKGGYEVRHRRTGEEKIVKADHLIDHIK